MKLICSFYIAILSFGFLSCGAEPKAGPDVEAKKQEDLKDLDAIIHTADGDIHVKLFGSKTPVTVANFVNLAKRGYWKESNFHRVVEGFVSQGGKHMSGTATPGYTIKNETYTENPAIADLKHSKPGMLAMARTMRPHTNGAQWYITHAQIKDLDGDYTVFGEVTKGLDIALKLSTGTKIKDVSISSDTSQVYEVYKDRIKEWNAILDRNFFNLRKLEEEKK